MTTPLSISEQQVSRNRDHRLLLDRLGNAGFDEAGRSLVVRAFTGGEFWVDLSDEEVMTLAVIAQQHGLFDQGLALLGWLNRQRPGFAEGWQAHAELLDTLGRGRESAQVVAQARRYLPAEVVAERLVGFKPLVKPRTPSLAKYAALVTSADKGAILKVPETV